MNHIKLLNTPNKKIWTEPALTVIELRSARSGHPAAASDSGTNHRS
jgi:hypothetical protein